MMRTRGTLLVGSLVLLGGGATGPTWPERAGGPRRGEAL